MPFGRKLTLSFGDPRLLQIVLSDPDFATRGYIWGSDGHMTYCFANPDKVRFEIFRKSFWWRYLLLAWVPPVLYWALIWPRHYTRSAKAQPASVVTNGPMMHLPLNMGPNGLRAVLLVAWLLPVVLCALVGSLLGTIPLGPLGSAAGWLVGALVGAIAGLSTAVVAFWVVGWLCYPYGAVQGPGGLGESAAADDGTFYFGRSGTAFASYAIGPDNPPPALTWASGGLTPIVVGGAPASVLGGWKGQNYLDLMLRAPELVVWALVTWDLGKEPILELAIESQSYHYGATPPNGVIVVAGTDTWSTTDTADLITQRAVDAVATDGSTSVLLGSSGELVLEPTEGKDVIERYGFVLLPE